MIFIRRVSHLRDVQCLFFEINESGCEAFDNIYFLLAQIQFVSQQRCYFQPPFESECF